MLPESRLHLVSDPDDSVDSAQLLTNLHEPLDGRLVCEAQPDERRKYQLAWDILAALGKDLRQAGQVRSLGLVWPSLVAWLVGTPVEHLFVSRAHLLNAGAWRTLLNLAAEADTELWLLVQGTELSRYQRELTAEWPISEHSFGAFRTRWSRTANRRQVKTEATPEPFPEVPDEDFPVFRAAVRELLDPRAFARVDRAFTRSLTETRRWCAGGGATDEEAVAAHLQGRLRGCAELPELLTRLRAMQVAFFHERLLVRVDLERLAARETLATAASLHSVALVRLRRYVLPRYPAAALLAQTAEASPAQLAQLTLADIAQDGTSLSVNGQTYAIGDGADILRSYRHYRIAEGAREDSPLFIKLETPGGHQEPEPMGMQSLHQMLQRIARETGLPLLNRWTPRKPRSARRDVHLAGIRIDRF